MPVENMTLAPFYAGNRNPFNYAKIEQVSRDLATAWLTLDEITQQLNLFQDESQDQYLESIELATRMAIEDFLGMAIFPTTWRTYYANLGVYNTQWFLDLPEVPQSLIDSLIAKEASVEATGSETAHIRNKQPGDYLRKLKPETQKRISEDLGEVLAKLGYL